MRRSPLSRRLAAILAAALAFQLAAQEPSTEPQSGLVLRSSSRLVEVTVLAHDREGHPAANLTRDDFTILDDGKPRPIALFLAGSSRQPAPSPASAGTFTNRIDSGTGSRATYTVILLDWLNTTWSDQAQARAKVVAMLQRIGPEDNVALYVLDRDLRILHEFSKDSTELLRDLGGLRSGNMPLESSQASAPYDASISPMAAALYQSALNAPGRDASKQEQLFYLDRRVSETLQALRAVADHLASVPGRKSLIWVSAAFPLLVDSRVVRDAAPAERNYSSDLEETLRRMNHADVAIYPIDARGLSVDPNAYINIGTMREAADRTGGRAWFNRNDLDEGMRSALEDIRLSYTLGIYVPEDARSGFHKIDVHVRRPGVTLRYRRGYDAGDRNGQKRAVAER